MYFLDIPVDTRPPTIANCPSDISLTMELGTPGTPVSWTEPTAADPSGVSDIVLQSHKPGTVFGSGASVVTYVFADASGNLARCTFTVIIRTGKNSAKENVINADKNGRNNRQKRRDVRECLTYSPSLKLRVDDFFSVTGRSILSDIRKRQ